MVAVAHARRRRGDPGLRRRADHGVVLGTRGSLVRGTGAGDARMVAVAVRRGARRAARRPPPRGADRRAAPARSTGRRRRALGRRRAPGPDRGDRSGDGDTVGRRTRRGGSVAAGAPALRAARRLGPHGTLGADPARVRRAVARLPGARRAPARRSGPDDARPALLPELRRAPAVAGRPPVRGDGAGRPGELDPVARVGRRRRPLASSPRAPGTCSRRRRRRVRCARRSSSWRAGCRPPPPPRSPRVRPGTATT